jgi:acetolactate synthase I/II/III large subunit
MKVSDYITNFLIERGVQKCFSVTGGFAMHLNDSFGEKFDVTYTHGEQPAGYAALGWSAYEHDPSICCVTSGCGATNAITPCLIAYQDSVPVFFISGQVQSKDNIRSRGGRDRGYFGSDCNIIESVKGITKYAVELIDPKDTHRILEKCYENLTTGRLGPIWLSIPIDVQSMEVPTTSPARARRQLSTCSWASPLDDLPRDFLDLWSKSKRPIVLAGNGIHLSKSKREFRDFLNHHKLPYVVSYFGSDLGDDYTGKVGILGNRSGNFAIQNADLILCLGCRLSKSITGYNRQLFAREAKIVYIDIDKSEFMDEKKVDVKVHMDLKTFFGIDLPKQDILGSWIDKNKEWKDNWSDELPPKTGNLICPYQHLNTFFNKKPSDSCITASSGSIYCVVWHMFKCKNNDRFITSSHGDMGYELPVAIGASMHGKRTYAILGDGSFQFNLQELQTLKHHNLPVTVMVFNNGGYGAIKITQTTVFKREFGTSSVSDITFCDVERVVKAYDIRYYKVNSDDDVEYLKHVDGPIVVEIICNEQKRFPSVSNKPMQDGTFKNMPHEEMAPFLDDEVMEKNMFVKRV